MDELKRSFQEWNSTTIKITLGLDRNTEHIGFLGHGAERPLGKIRIKDLSK